ncbi:transcriptional regulator (plasmid) [Nostoc sp. CENA543]|uniref:helix-turn-helix domain-containing protein n=1 Tax=Nostoc sp. CENA543 TaxID=1869241 RepID=UPI000CA15E71|nr:helix-turn-helix transcriptional regulator [Nostoc sp. CENA543]AUT04700.1 transcriptional regulator [Nostoc sp. CENA543]
MNQTFGRVIRQARKDKGYSQRELAKLIEVDYTYLSKLENDHAAYPPSKEVIRLLVRYLDLAEREEELIYLAGRITADDERIFQELVKQNYKQMPALFRMWRDNPHSVQKLLEEPIQPENEEKES